MPRSGSKPKGGKSPKLAIYMSVEEQKDLADAANALGLSASQVIRTAVREYINARFEEGKLKYSASVPNTFPDLIEYSLARKRDMDAVWFAEIEQRLADLKSHGERPGLRTRQYRVTDKDGQWAFNDPDSES